ncbi:hypothetical protein ABES23_06130 [Peribacillus frigoritolerans]|uniref:hypothetical protein n=1 Tax=Peribacillus frigoritolerans TaxID=450367 RepID=UPI003D27FBF5
MSARLVDIVDQLTHAIDYKVHATRGERFERRERKDFEAAKERASEMFKNNRPENTVFRIAQICKISVMTARDIENEVLGGRKYAETIT